MFCPNCGKELDNGSELCADCGAKIDNNAVETAEQQNVNESHIPAEEVMNADITAGITANENDVSETADTTETTDGQPLSTAEKAEKEPEFISSEEFLKKYDLYYTPEGQEAPKRPAPTPKKKPKKRLIPFVLAVLVILVGVAAAVVVIGNKDAEEQSSEGNIDYSETADITSSDDAVSDDIDSSGESVSDKKLNSENIQGDWAFKLSVSEMDVLNGEETASVSGFTTDAEYNLYIRFNADETMQLICSKEDFKATYEAYLEDYFMYLRNGGYYEIRQAEGFSKESTDKLLEEMGMTVELLVDDLEEKMLSEDVTAAKILTEDGFILLTDPQKSTKYTLEKGKIVFVTDEDITRETYISFEYESGVITVTDGDYAEGVLIEKTLTKKN